MSKPGIYQQSTWRVLATILVVIVWCVIVVWLWPESRDDGLIVGVVSYLIIARGLRHWILGHGRRGVKAFEEEHYDEAIEHFRKSEQMLRAHPWIDTWRTVLAQSASAISLLEISLMNMVLAQMNAGRPSEARRSLDALIEEFPQNQIAQGTLKTWEMMQRTPEIGSQAS